MRGHFVNALVHGVRRVRALSDLDRFRLIEEAVRQGFDLFGKRGGKHQGLPASWQKGNDFFDVRQESHVEHAVRLVEHEHFQQPEIELLAADEIEQAAGGGDDDVDALAQRLDLRLFLDAAENRGHADRQALAVVADVFHDLHGELAGGGEDERLEPAWLARAVRVGEAVEHRQHESRRLAGAGLGDGDDVHAQHHLGNGGGLHRRRAGVACFLNRAEDPGLESEVAERHARTLDRWDG